MFPHIICCCGREGKTGGMPFWHMPCELRFYHCYQVPDESLHPFVCTVDNPGNGNAAKNLFLELVRHSSASALGSVSA